jgi:hypothetical protein
MQISPDTWAARNGNIAVRPSSCALRLPPTQLVGGLLRVPSMFDSLEVQVLCPT